VVHVMLLPRFSVLYFSISTFDLLLLLFRGYENLPVAAWHFHPIPVLKACGDSGGLAPLTLNVGMDVTG
jgi:hypothetical protein